MEKGIWECRTGIEGVRSVPLEETIVTWIEEKELLEMSVSLCH